MSQVLGRLRLVARATLGPRPALDRRPAPPLRPRRGSWVTPPARQPSLLAAQRFRFLGEEHDLAEEGWDASHVALLWRYNLHYFDDLNALGHAEREPWHRALVERWITDHVEAKQRPTGTPWAPYPTSLRIVNWIKWLAGGRPAHDRWLHGLAIQVRWLERHLEWHLLGNHLLANAKALAFAGLFFEGAEAERWLAKGFGIVERELAEQILADGGHFERSPMYHALALEDLLDLLNAARLYAPGGETAALQEKIRERAAAMLLWLRTMTHPDGTMARFNDCAEGIAPHRSEIERCAAALDVHAAAPAQGIAHLAASGYLRAARGAAVAFLDVAPVGPDYLPGHAHADTLSFELSVAGRQLIVNRGTSIYGDGPRRQLERGTAAHSTVQIGAHDSSEVWSGFRVGRRARPGPVNIEGPTVRASHDGYGSLPGKPRHLRSWTLEASALTVLDLIEPLPREPAVARFHLAPGLHALADAPNRWHIASDCAPQAQLEVLEGSASLEGWQHAQRFGEQADAQTLAVQLASGRALVRLSWPG